MTGGRFALFADCLLLGLFTALAAIPIVTAYPAFVTACTMLRDGSAVGPRTYLSRFRAVAGSAPFLWWGPSCALAVTAVDIVAISAGVPGAKPLAALLSLAAATAAVIALRLAGGWQPDRRWRTELAAAARGAGHDLGGSALLLLAAACAVGIVALVPITALLVAGPLAVAAVAIESRPRSAGRRSPANAVAAVAIEFRHPATAKAAAERNGHV
ncbi:hypothetical protein Rhe02_09950 [Rhizocola hellebori]|uniref:DUF624 domain-containing protein n=1 Tax=Rhizocola hellebori TaxID=1392758 RepID=A0A8J3Q2X1_9ACTN|nr:hypothetical protein [Rhizocola hellebori]GIH02928.1 hypothetical protein Rhe02_09950 [Rhizocola hellebori]